MYVISIYIIMCVLYVCVCRDETLAKEVAIIQVHQKVQKTEPATRVISTHVSLSSLPKDCQKLVFLNLCL